MSYVESLKLKSRGVNFEPKIQILDDFDEPMGSLVPVGTWTLEDKSILGEIVSWRNRFNKMFPTRTTVDIESTINFLDQTYIINPNAILFLIYTKDQELIGHIGLSNLDRDAFELTNLIRGASGGGDQIIYHTEMTLITLGFQITEKSECFVELMSYNWIVRDLHERVGFKKVKSYPLKKLENKRGIIHKKVNKEDSNVPYCIEVLSLSKPVYINEPKKG